MAEEQSEVKNLVKDFINLKLDFVSLKNSEIRYYIYVDDISLLEIIDELEINLNRTQMCINFELSRDEFRHVAFVTKILPGNKWFSMCLNPEVNKVKFLCLKKNIDPKYINAKLKSGGNEFNEYYDLVQKKPNRSDLRMMNGGKSLYENAKAFTKFIINY